MRKARGSTRRGGDRRVEPRAEARENAPPPAPTTWTRRRLVAALVAAAAVVLAAMEPAQEATRQTIFDFSVLDAEGMQVSLADYRERGRVAVSGRSKQARRSIYD